MENFSDLCCLFRSKLIGIKQYVQKSNLGEVQDASIDAEIYSDFNSVD